MDQACDLAGERHVGQDINNNLCVLAQADLRRICQWHIDANLQFFRVVQVDGVR